MGHWGQTLTYDRAATKRESSQVIPEKASKSMEKQEKGVTAGFRDGSQRGETENAPVLPPPSYLVDGGGGGETAIREAPGQLQKQGRGGKEDREASTQARGWRTPQSGFLSTEHLRVSPWV